MIFHNTINSQITCMFGVFFIQINVLLTLPCPCRGEDSKQLQKHPHFCSGRKKQDFCCTELNDTGIRLVK